MKNSLWETSYPKVEFLVSSYEINKAKVNYPTLADGRLGWGTHIDQVPATFPW
jgi:hypothetical protein